MPLSLQLLRNGFVALITLKRQLMKDEMALEMRLSCRSTLLCRDSIGFYKSSIGIMEKNGNYYNKKNKNKWGTYNLASTKNG